MKKILFALVLIPLLFTGCAKKGEEVAGADGQTFLKVTVLEDNVDLRYHPREESTLCDKKLNKGDVVYVAGGIRRRWQKGVLGTGIYGM